MTPSTSVGTRRPRKFLILPGDIEVGWTPFLWLIYLVGPFLYLILGPDEPLDWALAAASAAIFLPLYFWGYWSTGRRLLGIVAAITLLAAVYTPLNPGGFVYFVYAGAFVGYAVGAGMALRALAAIAAVLGVETWLFGLHPSAWIPGIVFTVLVGLTSIHYAEVQRKNVSLRRAREEVERVAKSAERERIARDLHDLLGHTLTVISVKSDLAVRLADREPARARSEMEEVHRTARGALAEVRRAVLGYRAGGSGGLARELDSVRAALSSGGVSLRLEGSPDDLAPGAIDGIAPEQEEALAFALREAVTNVLRHARASCCTVRFERNDHHARLVVADDGRATAAGPGDGSIQGQGLAGMRERVEGLGGHLVLTRTDGKGRSSGGTTLTVQLPLVERPRDRAAGEATR